MLAYKTTSEEIQEPRTMTNHELQYSQASNASNGIIDGLSVLFPELRLQTSQCPSSNFSNPVQLYPTNLLRIILTRKHILQE